MSNKITLSDEAIANLKRVIKIRKGKKNAPETVVEAAEYVIERGKNRLGALDKYNSKDPSEKPPKKSKPKKEKAAKKGKVKKSAEKPAKKKKKAAAEATEKPAKKKKKASADSAEKTAKKKKSKAKKVAPEIEVDEAPEEEHEDNFSADFSDEDDENAAE